MEINFETNMHYVVTVDDPGPYGGDNPIDVHTDGRDWAALEAKQLPPNALLTSVRFLAWNALFRQQRTRRTWQQFNTLDCLQITVAPNDDADEQEGEQGLDPGQTGQNAADGSASPSRPGNRSRGRAGSSAGTTGT